jgi:hypothetical protein
MYVQKSDLAAPRASLENVQEDCQDVGIVRKKEHDTSSTVAARSDLTE